MGTLQLAPLRIIQLLILVPLLTCILAASPSEQDSLTLNVCVQTSKPSYPQGELVGIFGNVTYAGEPVASQLIVLEVCDPFQDVVFTRCLQTGSVGEYSSTTRLSDEARLGVYSAQVSTAFLGRKVTNDTTFYVFQKPGGGNSKRSVW